MQRAFCQAVAARWGEALAGGPPLYDGEAPDGRALPYVVFNVVAGSPDYSFGGLSLEALLVQFDVYAKDKTQAWAHFASLALAFDDCSMPVSGWELVKMERDGFHRDFDGGSCRVTVTYTAQLQPL